MGLSWPPGKYSVVPEVIVLLGVVVAGRLCGIWLMILRGKYKIM